MVDDGTGNRSHQSPPKSFTMTADDDQIRTPFLSFFDYYPVRITANDLSRYIQLLVWKTFPNIGFGILNVPFGLSYQGLVEHMLVLFRQFAGVDRAGHDPLGRRDDVYLGLARDDKFTSLGDRRLTIIRTVRRYKDLHEGASCTLYLLKNLRHTYSDLLTVATQTAKASSNL